MTWVLTLLGIVALIVLHEAGHYAVAKAVGMRVERFSIFFPPRLAGFRRGETDYAIGAIPAGGYVKITGMTWEEIKDMDLRLAARAYCMQAPWKRVAVIVAGPGVNILIALVLFTAVLVGGGLNGAIALGNLDTSAQTLQASTGVQEVERGSPASGVLRAGDRIVAIDGRPATVHSVVAGISSHRCSGAQVQGCSAATPVTLTVKRRGSLQRLSVYPRYDASAKRMLVGFEFAPVAKGFGLLAALGTSAGAMWHVTTQTLTDFSRALTESKERKQLHSILGITEVGHETVVAGAGYAFVFLGFLSLILAVINLFPFLPLDGGHVLWALAEKVRGGRISLLSMYRFSSVGIILLVFLVVNGLSNDISRLTG